MTEEIIRCPICKDEEEAGNCMFISKIKTKEGKEMLCCCPSQINKVNK